MNKLRKIIDHYGQEHQIAKAKEELHELIQAIIEDDKDHITEEMADVVVMLWQLVIIYEIDVLEIPKIMDYKINRTIKRIEQEGAFDE